VAKDVYIVPTLAVWKAYNMLGSAADNLGRFVAAGGKVALGDDYGSAEGFALGMPMRDIEMMKEAGMTSMQIIVAGTQHGAHVCSLGDELGTLEEGKVADVLVVNGDPLQNIHALVETWMVIHGGTVIRSPGG
jgi:imidazolonepropionase-like amidohydrolase